MPNRYDLNIDVVLYLKKLGHPIVKILHNYLPPSKDLYSLLLWVKLSLESTYQPKLGESEDQGSNLVMQLMIKVLGK